MAKRQTGQDRKPAPGSRLPSQVLADNLRAYRLLRRLSQDDLAERMAALGHASWRRPTVSQVERGFRTVSVDELAALAIILQIGVPFLLDPTGPEGRDETPVDVGLPNGPVRPEVIWSAISDERPAITIVWEGNKAVARSLVGTRETQEWKKEEDRLKVNWSEPGEE